MQTTHENKRLPVIWLSILGYYEGFPRTSHLDRHVLVSDDGEPVGFQIEPDTSDQASVWSWGVEIQIAAMRSVSTFFVLMVPELEALSKQLAELLKTTVR